MPEAHSSTASPWYRHWRWIAVGMALASVASMTTLCTLFLLFVYLPQRFTQAPWSEPWMAYNVNIMNFKDPKQFKQAQHFLRNNLFTRSAVNDPIPRILIADLFVALGKTSAAEYFYEEALRISESNWLNTLVMQSLSDHVREELALIYYKQHRYQLSLNTLNSIDHWEEKSDKPLLLSALKDRLENPDRAEFHLALARELKRELMLTCAAQEGNLAIQAGGSPALALESQQFTQLEMPKNPHSLTDLARYYLLAGNVLSQMDDPAKAVRYYLKAAQDAPDFEWTYNALANTYEDLGDYNKARQYAEKAIALNPNFYHPHLLLGDLHLAKGHYQEAVQHYRQGQAIMRQLPEALTERHMVNVDNQLAYAYEQLHQYELAGQYYRQTLDRAQQSDEDLEHEYNYAQSGLARLRKAHSINF